MKGKRYRKRVLALLLGAVGYKGFVSIEMGKTELANVHSALRHIAEVFA